MCFYYVRVDALSFVTRTFLNILPILHLLLGFLLAGLTVAFLIRIVLTWYPPKNLNEGFWPLLAWPTEPFLKITRLIVPPIGGVDITPVIWVGLLSLLRELLVGPQGILSQLLQGAKNLG